jgi:hypothetical protein
LVIRENEKKEPAYITKYQYQSKIRQKRSSTPPFFPPFFASHAHSGETLHALLAAKKRFLSLFASHAHSGETLYALLAAKKRIQH